MSQNVTKSDPWMTGQRRRAALLVADDEMTNEQIAADVGLGDVRTLYRWKEAPQFQAAVAEHRRRLEESISRLWIAKRRKRVQVLQRLADGMLTIMDERGLVAPMDRTYDEDLDEWSEAPTIPGQGTGLIVKDIKSVGYGDDAELVDVYRTDAGLSAELRNVLKQAAQEVGQWADRHQLEGKDGDALTQVVFMLPEKTGDVSGLVHNDVQVSSDAPQDAEDGQGE